MFATDRGGAIMGSVGAFMVLEPVDAASARGARIFAEISGVETAQARRRPGEVATALGDLIGALGGFSEDVRVLSSASGVAPWTMEEHDAIAARLPGADIVATGDLVGHGLEAAFPAATALAAALIADGGAADALVTGAGHWRGEGAARLVAPGSEDGA